MKKKTLLDVYLSAHKAALASLDIKSIHAVAGHKLESFAADAIHSDDWTYWLNTFNSLRGEFLNLRAAPSLGEPKPTAAPDAPAKK
ncbi:MAG: hypothetical protein JWR69_80 [Pedosphaera sp.]|nr:hypothetical protein [Pedosphaera sp.]